MSNLVAGSVYRTNATVNLPWVSDGNTAFPTSANVAAVLIDNKGSAQATGIVSNVIVSQIALLVDPLPVGVTFQVEIAIPEGLPTAVGGTEYHIRYTVNYTGSAPVYSFEHLTVMPNFEALYGPQTSVVLANTPAQMIYVTDPLPASPLLTLYDAQNRVLLQNVQSTTTYHNQLQVNSVTLDLVATPLRATLDPYVAVWTTQSPTGNPRGLQDFESGNLFVVNASILAAGNDVVNYLNKAHAELHDAQLRFTPDQVLEFLRQGRDMWNFISHPTNVDMTNAQNQIRYSWIQCAIIYGLRAQTLTEIQKAFDFSGQSVALSVNRQDAFESMASALESALMEPLKQLKVNLCKRGQAQGDGSQNPLAARYGAIGSLGVSSSPVSRIPGLNPYAASQLGGGMWGVGILN